MLATPRVGALTNNGAVARSAIDLVESFPGANERALHTPVRRSFIYNSVTMRDLQWGIGHEAKASSL